MRETSSIVVPNEPIANLRLPHGRKSALAPNMVPGHTGPLSDLDALLGDTMRKETRSTVGWILAQGDAQTSDFGQVVFMWADVLLKPTEEIEAALRDIDNLADEAADLEYTPPTEVTIGNVKGILDQVTGPRLKLSVYCCGDDEVAVEVSPGRGLPKGMIVICSGDGAVLCLVDDGKPDGRLQTPNGANDPRLVAYMNVVMRELSGDAWQSK